jgi:signal transduction histidine kinase/HAMP domain-containing protein
MRVKFKNLLFPVWWSSFAILVFVLLVKWGVISTTSMGISVSSLEIVLIIYALALGLVQVARQSHRLKKLSAIATDLGSGQLNKRSDDLNFDSIGNLAHTINKMADQIERSIEDLREVSGSLEEQNDELHEVLKIEARFGSFLESIATVQTGELAKISLKAFRDISDASAAWLVYYDPESGHNTYSRSSATEYRILPDIPFEKSTLDITGGRRWNYVELGDEFEGSKGLYIPIHFDNKPLGFVILEVESEMDSREKRRLGNYIEAFSNALSNCVSYQTALRQSIRLESINRELLLADQNRSNFVARMSHELRTPLNSIIGFSKIMEKNKPGNLNEVDLDRLEKIHRNGNHLLQMINNILDLSKVEAGEMQVQEDLVDLEEIAGDVIDMLQPQSESKGLYLIKDFEERGLTTCTDGLKLRQVLVNLVGNAIKFTHTGGVKVRCYVPEDNTTCVHLDVSDSGIGIDVNKHEKIFRAFSQADHTTPQEFGGTGLGLTISRSIVHLLGGSLDLSSVPGRGSVFTVKLPLRIKTNSGEISGLFVKKEA